MKNYCAFIADCFFLLIFLYLLQIDSYKEFANWHFKIIRIFIRCYVVVERYDCEQSSDIRRFRITADTTDTVVSSYGRAEREISNRLRDTVVPQVVMEQPVESLQRIRHCNRRSSFNSAALHEFPSKRRQQSELSHLQVKLQNVV